MSDEVNRFVTPLPDSVLDRYFAEHPEEKDWRQRVAPPQPTNLDSDDVFGHPSLDNG
jgi:hypothetical protein